MGSCCERTRCFEKSLRTAKCCEFAIAFTFAVEMVCHSVQKGVRNFIQKQRAASTRLAQSPRSLNQLRKLCTWPNQLLNFGTSARRESTVLILCYFCPRVARVLVQWTDPSRVPPGVKKRSQHRNLILTHCFFFRKWASESQLSGIIFS